MCGVIGYFSKSPSDDHVALIERLFEASKIRGLHAFGATARAQDGKLMTFKTTALREIKQWLRGIPRFDLLIGHTRYSTSGDWRQPENNQPIVVAGSSLVFNGVISQASKKEYEKIFSKTYETGNDGEIFLRKVIDGEDWAQFVREGKFSFAGAFLHNGEAVAIRNKNRPLWSCETADANFLASTQDIFKRAGFSHQTPIEVKPGEVYQICSRR